MIGQGVPEVKPHLRLVQVVVYPSMTRNAASLRTAPRGNTTVIGMIFAASFKIAQSIEINWQAIVILLIIFLINFKFKVIFASSTTLLFS